MGLKRTAYKTIASNTTLAEYFVRYGEFSQAKTVFTPEDIYLGQLVGIYEALNAGVTSILDHAHSTFSRETASASLNASMDGGTSNIFAFTTHYLGGPWFFANSPKLLRDLDFLNTSFPIVFSHSSFITPGDTHFTCSADMVTQARLWLQSMRLEFFRQTLNRWRIPGNSPMSVNQAFLLAMREGGLALRGPDIGVIQSPNMLGWADPVAAGIMHSNVGDVEHVLVNEEWRKKDRQLVLKDGLNMTRDESAKRIQEVWMQTPLPDLEGEFQPGAPYAGADVEDVVRGNGRGYQIKQCHSPTATVNYLNY
ncbi:hypothetical protein K435DRAFT_822115 [Dendrothele bispora CBS 962.96]|uniref:Amidohydrolase-related domain-containing protein n=1 Tax=Dendrothele bispora (strain CBS 962.96) TaxID=1314807 RepID=A0A4S8LCP9_DENBC|nr:hypothetical protein K435DRAFT_822115 [Dendrothele bispora CBS 962.96]